MLTYRSEASLPGGIFEALLTSLAGISQSSLNAIQDIVLDGMPTELLHSRSGTLVMKAKGNAAAKGDFAALVALAIGAAWQCISNPHCRNSLADAAEYVGKSLPRETELARKPVVETMVLGAEKDRVQVLEALRKHHEGSA